MESNEILDADAGFPNQGAEGSLPDFAMIGNGETAMRRLRMAEDDVAAALSVDLVTEPPERRNDLSTGDSGKGAHTATSMISSLIVGGMGSSRSRRLST